jgi:cystathionine gamma-lyase
MTPEHGWGPSTRVVRAGWSGSEPGEPLGPPVVLAAPYVLPGEAAPEGYGRYVNPTWTALETAIGALEGGPALVFASGMAAIDAVLRSVDGPLVAPADGYFTLRSLVPGARFVPTRTEAYLEAVAGAALVWVETPSNPRLDVVDIAAVAEAAHAAGALLAVDNSVATPLGQRPLALGADFSVCAGTKGLSGHSDVLYGVVAARDSERLAPVLTVRSHAGAVLGPFEAWVAHRSLATLELRLERASATSLALYEALRDRGVAAFHPSASDIALDQMRHFGPVVGFDLESEAAAAEFFARTELVTEATSFGGVHTTAERRARWGTDDVGPGFVRLSAGVEDTADVVADVLGSVRT